MKKAIIILTVLAAICCFCAIGCAQPQTYKITFVQEGESDVVYEVQEGGSLSSDKIPALTPKTGYTLKWSVTDFSNVQSDMTVTCIKTPKEYRLNFNTLGGRLIATDGSPLFSNSQTFAYGERYELPLAEREGYNFAGWYVWRMTYPEQSQGHTYGKLENSGTWDIINELNGERSLIAYAAWSYDIIFRQAGFEDVCLTFKQTANGSTQINENLIPEPQEEEGYDVSWNLSLDEILELRQSAVITAEKSGKIVKVWFNTEADLSLNGKPLSVDESKKMQYVYLTCGENFVLPVPEVAGKTFVKWQTASGDDITDGKWSVADNVVLSPVFTTKQPECFSVTFVLGEGKSDVVKTLTEGEQLTLADIPAFNDTLGYDYKWQIAGVDVSVEDILGLTADATVTAVKTPKNVTLRFVCGAQGTIEQQTLVVEYGERVTLPAPDSDEYRFKSWAIEGSEIQSALQWTLCERAEYTLSAVWQYSVTFVQEGKQNVVKWVDTGKTLTDIPAPAPVEGHRVYWSVTDFSTVTDNAVVNAIVQPETYKIYLDTVYSVTSLKGAAYDETQKLWYIEAAYGQTVSLPLYGDWVTVGAERMTFSGWKCGETTVSSVKVTGQITLTAVWVNAKNDGGWSENR